MTVRINSPDRQVLFGPIQQRRLARRRLGLTRVGLIVVVAIAAIGLSLLIPFVQRMRESSRRQTCLDRAHTIGTAIQEYGTIYANAIPPSAQTFGVPSATRIGGYSFLVKILSFMDHNALYKTLPTNVGRHGDLDEILPKCPALATAMNTSLSDFVCPCNTNRHFQNATAQPPQFAFTNYKASGASTRGSLLMAANSAGVPPYGPVSLHPDGAIYPACGNLPLSSIQDGTSHTIAIMETMDDTNSRWMVGNECTLVGMPQESSPTGAKPTAPYVYFTPPGYSETGTDRSDWAWQCDARTFLSYDFSPVGTDVGKYEDTGWANGPAAYGPSSMHPGVVIVGVCDGSVMALSKQCDAGLLFFFITKNDNDPLGGF
jgi:hypothetical protein